MENLLLKNREFVVLDIETTGFSLQKGARIIELAAIHVKDGKVLKEFHHYIDPKQKIPLKITELTGITNEMVKGKPSAFQVLRDFQSFISGQIIVAHNAKFDWDGFIKPGYKQMGIDVNNPVVDTLEIAKILHPTIKSRKLNILCEMYKIELINHHSGIADARATADLLFAMKEDLKIQRIDIFDSSETLNEYEIQKAKFQDNILYIVSSHGKAILDYSNNKWRKEPSVNLDLLKEALFKKAGVKNETELLTKMKGKVS